MSAFAVLREAFARHDGVVFEIEVLGSSAFVPSGQMILQDGLSLGIPKKVLAAAFVEARHVLMRRDEPGVERLDVLHAARIIILFDPEHLTAVNYLKRSLASLERQDPTEQQLATVFRTEIAFLDSILTSPLHRQTKSPTLWHHRHWLLLSRLRSSWASKLNFDVHELVRHEWKVVMKSSERHPHNYYAWQYLRRLVGCLEESFWASESCQDSVTIDELCHEVTSWCIQHPSDISGWSFLLHLNSVGPPKLPDEVAVRERIRVVNFAESMRWRGEGLWVFLEGLPKWSGSERMQAVKQYVHEGTSGTSVKA